MTPLSDLLRPRRYFHLRSKRNKQEFGMTTRHGQHWLRTYAAQTYRGTGAIVDLGCFLGASTPKENKWKDSSPRAGVFCPNSSGEPRNGGTRSWCTRKI